MRLLLLPALLLPALLLLAAAPAPVLRSATLDLPDEATALEGDADAQLVLANCTACHSLSMIAYQPRMDAAHWQAEVDKMRATYKAPVDEADGKRIAAILATRWATLPK